jgi:hypothetical protein
LTDSHARLTVEQLRSVCAGSGAADCVAPIGSSEQLVELTNELPRILVLDGRPAHPGNLRTPRRPQNGSVPFFMIDTTCTAKFGTMACSSIGVDRGSVMSTMASRLSRASRMMLSTRFR